MVLNLRAATADAAAPAWADQAAGLRSLLARTSVRVLSVAGSGTGSGHSAITAQLAQCAALAAQVAVLDQTGGEVARRLGLTVPHDLDDMLTGRLEFDAVARRTGAWRLLPAQRGLTRLLAAGAAGPAFFRGFLALREPVYAGALPPDHAGVPFGVNRRVPTPACAAALAQIAATLPAWGVAEYGLDTEVPALNAGGALARLPRGQVSSARGSHV